MSHGRGIPVPANGRRRNTLVVELGGDGPERQLLGALPNDPTPDLLGQHWWLTRSLALCLSHGVSSLDALSDAT